MPASYPPVLGGLQTVAHNLAKQLLMRGHKLRVVTNRYPVNLPARETIEGVTVNRLLFLKPQFDHLRRHRFDLFAGSLYFGPSSSRQFGRILRQFRPEVVNVHFPAYQIEAILKLRQQLDFRLVVSLHGHDVQQFVNGEGLKNGPQADALSRLSRLLKSADAVTAVSEDLLRKAMKLEPDIRGQAQVIPNGIDPDRFANAAAYQHSRPYVLALGRLVRKKGFDLLIDAYAQRRSEHNLDLVIAGTGEELHALKQQVESLGLTGAVHFFGLALPDEVVKLMNGSSGIVVPSREEPFGIVALEALAAGKRLVATETGGMKELLNDLAINGGEASAATNRRIFLVKPSVEGIAAGLHELFKAIENGCSLNDFSIPDKYIWAQVAQHYEQILLAR